MVDAPDLGSGGENCGGSSPSARTMGEKLMQDIKVLKETALERECELVINPEELKKRTLRYLEEKASKTKADGFRPGKVPLEVVFQQHGRAAMDQAIKDAISQRATEISGDKELAAPLTYHIQGQPMGSSLEDIGSLTVHIQAIFKPAAPEISWKEITLQDYTIAPSEDEISKAIEEEASRTMTSIGLETKRPSQKGDTLVYQMQYKTAEGHIKDVEGAFQLGSGALPEEFEKTLEGIDEGHIFNEKLRVPKNFPEKNLAGKKVEFRILFTEIRQTVPHNPDDTFAQSKGAKDLADYKQKVRESLIQQAIPVVQALKHNDLVKQLSEQLTFDIPEAMVESQFQHLWSTGPVGREESEEGKKKALESLNKSEEEYKEDLRQRARNSTRLSFILQSIVKNQKLSVEQKELSAYMHVISQRSRMPVEEVIEFLRRNPQQAEVIVDEILERKALDWAIQQCQSETQQVTLDELKTIFNGRSS